MAFLFTPLRSRFLVLLACTQIFLLMYFFSIKRWYNRLDHIVKNNNTPNPIELLYKDYISGYLKNYRWPPGTNQKDYTIMEGGQPIRSIIVTTWRSGSTFLGAILSTVPCSLYYYEPLIDYGVTRIHGRSKDVVETLKNLLNCNFSGVIDNLHYGRFGNMILENNKWLLGEHEHLYNHYLSYGQDTILDGTCRLSPFQVMKTVRLPLSLAHKLLDDKNLNVKVVLLIRDPRAVYLSRKRHKMWCSYGADCNRIDLLCADMVADYNTAISFKTKFPGRFTVLRYEDLSVDVYNHIQQLFNFLGLYYHDSVRKFIESCTQRNIERKCPSKIFRDKNEQFLSWRRKINWVEILNIQKECKEAMKLWGYVEVTKKSLFTLLSYPIRIYTLK